SRAGAGADPRGAGAWRASGRDQLPLARGSPGEALHSRPCASRTAAARAAARTAVEPAAAGAARGGQGETSKRRRSGSQRPRAQRGVARGRAAGGGVMNIRVLIAVLLLACVELQKLEAERDALAVEWGQLQLEQSAWSTHARIEQVARKELNMTLVREARIVVSEDAD